MLKETMKPEDMEGEGAEEVVGVMGEAADIQLHHTQERSTKR